MKSKKIINIVFIKYFDEEEKKQACIFYRDGSASLVSYEDGLKACETVIQEQKITAKKALREMINKELIHVVSSEEFVNNHLKYVSHEPLDYDIIGETIDEQMNDVEATTTPIYVEDVDGLEAPEIEKDADNTEEEENSTTSEEDEDEEEQSIVVAPYAYENDFDDDKKLEDEELFVYDYDDSDEIVEPVENPSYAVDKTQEMDKVKETEKETEKGIIGFFKRQINKIKNSKLAKTITVCVTTICLAFGLYSCTGRKTAIGEMFNSNLGTQAKAADDPNKTGNNKNDDIQYDSAIAYEDNSYYDNYTYKQLLEVTTDQRQRQAMINVHDTLENFNGKFADAYVEPGKDIRAALSFEEVVALQQAYNDYSKQDIIAIFNGADIDSTQLSRAYRDASLQLMGAYVIETSANPVDMSTLIESEEGKAFYQRYHRMFLEAKEATGEDQLRKVNAFYQAVREDFPITDEVRTEGIAHADTYQSVMEGKGGAAPAVAPMIAAAEIMWQNLDVDYTLTDSQVDFLNDIGLCNYVDKKFEKIETITLGSCQEDEINPTYQQYRDAIIKEMKEKNIYVIDDAHRELTKLDAFQNAVNWHFKMDGEWTYSGGFYTTTESYTVTDSWTETSTTYREEETRVSKPIPKAEKDKIDAEIAKENERAKQAGEAAARDEQERMQKEEDKHARQVQKEVEQDAADFQQKIDDANSQIDKNYDSDPSNDKPVNEQDLGHGTKFDDEHSDGQGNLDNSVTHITTDPTGDQTGTELPDPNETGAEFDKKAPAASEEQETTDGEVQQRTVEDTDTTTYDTDTTAYDTDTTTYDTDTTSYETDTTTYDTDTTSYNTDTYTSSDPIVYSDIVETEDGSGYYEEMVNTYVESLASEDGAGQEAYEYTK